ncbi:MAG: DUF2249 domain-containing protein [Oscillochloridaceae bacterium]|nr:DUF2249 domain-containing protein [Chloroflexaceae bacterium]MDW8391660.1 DUF2249 domain-containing protein [Oscillochloridaceae bacterium]
MAGRDNRLRADNPHAQLVPDADHASATDDDAALRVTASAAREQALDVRGLPCSMRRAQVYAAAAALQPGESFVFINDHDPRHLHLLLCETFGVAWSWDYEEAGPERYAVRVGRPGQQ